MIDAIEEEDPDRHLDALIEPEAYEAYWERWDTALESCPHRAEDRCAGPVEESTGR